MTILRRIPRLIVILLGLLGLLGCIAAGVAAWIIQVRLDATRERLIARIEAALATVDGRVVRAQARVESLKITADGLKASVADWSKKAAVERLASQWRLKEHSQKLADAMADADLWLESSASTVETLAHFLAAAESTRAASLAVSLERLQERMETLKASLTQTKETIAGIRRLGLDEGEEQAEEERMARVLHLAVRLLATFGTIDEGLTDVRVRLALAREETWRLEATAHRWFWNGAIIATVLLGWMAAGQIALMILGRASAVA